jgi:hypothetical protein
MRQRTYERILERIERVDEDKDTLFCLHAMDLLGRFDRSRRAKT